MFLRASRLATLASRYSQTDRWRPEGDFRVADDSELMAIKAFHGTNPDMRLPEEAVAECYIFSYLRVIECVEISNLCSISIRP